MSSAQSRKNSHKKKYVIIASSILVVTIIVGFLSGYIQYGVAYSRCGRAPISADSWSFFGGGSSYDVPGSISYKIRYGNKYFCTRDEAEAAGIRPNPLSPEGLKRQQEIGG
jgi:hypothetical protein